MTLQDVAEYLLPTPTTEPGAGNGHARNLGKEARMLPTPQVADATGGHASRSGDRSDELMLPGIAVEVGTSRLLPTPTVTNASGNGRNGRGEDLLPGVAEAASIDWGPYAPAIERWEDILGQPAPAPVRHDGQGGKARLNPELPEWMMGVPPHWITDPLIWVGWSESAARKAQIKAAGNGVVRQQADAAVTALLARAPEALQSLLT